MNEQAETLNLFACRLHKIILWSYSLSFLELTWQFNRLKLHACLVSPFSQNVGALLTLHLTFGSKEGEKNNRKVFF